MTTYESDIKTISSNEEVVFGILSDLNNIQKLKDNPALADKAKDIQFDTDSCSFSVEGFGKVGFRIIEREPFKTIKLASENAPVQVNVWIQLKQVAENDTRLKLTLKAELPTMIKMMVDKKIKEGINLIADMLAKTLNQ
ncbi:MAG: SRPBCC domain-containing protein [Paludibacter sp.]|nr:SRPBCC domain-containing protein [Paludibacter sp.]